MSNTANNLFTRAFTRLKDHVATFRLLQDRSEEFNQILTRVYNAHPKLRDRDKVFFQGYMDAIKDELYRTSLVHGGFYGGQFYSTKSDRLDYYQLHGISPEAWRTHNSGGFYWLDARGKCNGSKPFFSR